MAAPSYTYTLTNGSTADASQVQQNFNDILNGVTDGTKDITISALTINGNTTIGSGVSKTLTINAVLSSSVLLGSDGAYDIGSTTAGLRYVHIGDGAGHVVRIGVPSMAADWNLTLPPDDGNAGDIARSNGSGTHYFGPVRNLGLANATTTNANDSIKIQGASAALSSTNPLYIQMPHHSSVGQVTTLTATADVTLLLTGCTWGMGGLGDFTDRELRVYAINDAGTLKWGVSNKGGYRTITVALSSATQADIDLQTEMLVTSTLTATSHCVEVGWFLADFDDTGGAAEDLWAVQVAAGEINVGIPVQTNTDWNSSLTFTPSGFGVISNSSFFSRRIGDSLHVRGYWKNGTVAATAAVITLPTGYKVDLTKIQGSTNGLVGKWYAPTAGASATLANYGPIYFNDGDATQVALTLAGANSLLEGKNGNNISNNSDGLDVEFNIPIIGWSAN